MELEHRHFSQLARYNRFVNGALVESLTRLPAAAIAEPRAGYFGSIQGILDHLITCDINWLRRFREVFPSDEPLRRPRLDPAGHAWRNFSFADFAEFRRERAVVDDLFVDWIAVADVSRFGEVLAYRDSHDKPLRYTFRDALSHVFNHQTHHRGQLSQILDELKVEHDWSNLIAVAEIP